MIVNFIIAKKKKNLEYNTFRILEYWNFYLILLFLFINVALFLYFWWIHTSHIFLKMILVEHTKDVYQFINALILKKQNNQWERKNY